MDVLFGQTGGLCASFPAMFFALQRTSACTHL